MSFQYYDLSSNQVYDLNETIPFEINMTLGNVVEPYIFTFYLVVYQIYIWMY